MSGKFIKVKRYVFSVLTLVIILSQTFGCAFTSRDELVDMLNKNDTIEIEIATPDSEEALGEEETVEWIELAYMTNNKDFRNRFDEALNIITFGDAGKNGVIYINPIDKSWEPNSTLSYAFQNKEFIKNYWENPKVVGELIDAVYDVYIDIDDEMAKPAIVNSYWNLFADTEEGYFNGDSVMSRAKFMSGVTKAEIPVDTEKTVSRNFKEQVGESEYLVLAEYMKDNSYLDIESKSLDTTTFNGIITRAEAIYLVVNRYFAIEYENIEIDKVEIFDDCKNAGDIATDKGIDKSRDKWKSRELAYSLNNANEGLPEDLYKAMVVAYEKELIPVDYDSRWDEGITKTEAINLIIRAYEELGTTYNAELGESTKLDIEQTEEVVDISKGYSLSDEDKEIIDDLVARFNINDVDAKALEEYITWRAEEGISVQDEIDEIAKGYEEKQAAQQKPVETQAPAKQTQPSKPKPQTQAPDKTPTQPKPQTQAPKPTQPKETQALKPVETQPAEREMTLEEIEEWRIENGWGSGNAYTDMTPEEESAAAEAWSNFK